MASLLLAAVTVAGMLIAVPTAASAETTWGVIAKDAYGRTVTKGWGSADQGGAYTTANAGGAGALSVSNGVGRIDGLKAGQTVTNSLNISALDVSVSGSVLVPSTQTNDYKLYHSLSARNQANGAGYRATVTMTKAGKVTLNASRTGTTPKSFTYVDLGAIAPTGVAVVGELEVTGTNPVTIQARAWKKGTAAPPWQITAIDADAARVSAQGGASLVDYASSLSAITLTVDDLSVEKGTTAVAPTPTAVAPTGARSIGTAAYPVPAGAVFVDVVAGNDANVGTQVSPLKTLSAGITKASTGGTVVLRRGTYNESVIVPSGKALTIQNYPGEAVWMDGSIPVRNWTKSGSSWVSSGWTPEFPNTIDGIADNPRYLEAAYPMATRPDQVFVDGVALAQVASPGAVIAGSFAVDYADNTLTIGTDPTNREVRASNLNQAIFVKSSGSTLQGFGVRRYATSSGSRGTIKMENINSTIRDMIVVDNATIGVTISNNGGLVDGLTAERNGLMGLGINAAYGMVVRNSVITENNSEHFKPAPVAGGIKITRSRGVTVVNNDTSRNFNSSGIWLDESVYDATIANNVSNGNGTTGIQLELSEKAIVANNEMVGNGGGLMIFNTGGVRIFNNTFGGNRYWGLKLAQDERRNATDSTGRDPRQPAPDPTVPWITKNIVVSNNAFGNGGSFQIYALDSRTNIPVDNMNVTIDGNLFNRRVVSSDPTMVGWGLGDNRTVVRYETPEALAAAKNSLWHNAITASSMPIATMSAAIIAARSVAIPIPADVAAAAGKVAGSKWVGRY